jgi:calcium-dependent protein kinase
MRTIGNAVRRCLNKSAVRLGFATLGISLGYTAHTAVKPSWSQPLCQEKPPVVNMRRYLITRHPYAEFPEDYEIVEKLGEGGFARIYKVRHKATGSIRVAKAVRLYSESDLQIFKNEVAVLTELDSPYVGRIVSYYLDNDRSVHASQSVPTAVLVYHFIDGVDLLDAMNDRISRRESFSNEEAWSLAYEIIRAVASLHQAGFVHRDIKPENFILVDQDGHKSLKLIDFGLASRSGAHEQVHEAGGTSFYMAPEIAEAHGTPPFTPIGDSWSIGVILATLASKGSSLIGRATSLGTSGRKPVSSVSIRDEINKLSAKGASPELIELIGLLLKHDPKSRLSPFDAIPKFDRLHQQDRDHIQLAEVEKLRAELRTFTCRPLLSRMVRGMLVHLTGDHLFVRRELLFRALDAYADGKVSIHDLAPQAPDDQAEIEKGLRHTKRSSGELSLPYSDFLAVGIDPRSSEFRNAVRHIFQMLSSPKGVINQESLERSLKKKGIDLDASDLLQSCNSNRGKQFMFELNYEEFLQCVNSLF